MCQLPEGDARSPEQREIERQIDALAAELRELLAATLAAPEDIDLSVRVMENHFAMQELFDRLEAYGGPKTDPADRMTAADLEEFRRHCEYMRNQQREPTQVELELRRLEERLAAKCQTVWPDFDALYQQRRDLERRMNARG